MKYIVVFILVPIINGLSAQMIAQTIAQTNNFQVTKFEDLKQQFYYKNDLTIQSEKHLTMSIQAIAEKENDTFEKTKSVSTLPNVYNYNHLAIFCKLEVQLEKATNFPIKFRLGEYNQIEKLEGKPYSPFLMEN